MMKLHIEFPEPLMKAMKEMPDGVGEVMLEVGKTWHESMLAPHFERGAHGRYGYAERSHSYLKSPKKRGKPDLVFSGDMQREMTGSAQFRQGSKMATVTFRARTLNFCPNIANSNDSEYVPHIRKRDNKTIQYPNLKREVRIVLDDEMEKLAQKAVNTVLKRFDVRV
jgi:hypothetical protein